MSSDREILLAEIGGMLYQVFLLSKLRNLGRRVLTNDDSDEIRHLTITRMECAFLDKNLQCTRTPNSQPRNVPDLRTEPKEVTATTNLIELAFRSFSTQRGEEVLAANLPDEWTSELSSAFTIWRWMAPGALVDTGREQAKHVIRNGKKDTTTSPLCWTAGANTVVSDQDQEPIQIWILTCRWFVTIGILPGSWWAYHELGRGSWWFRDPVENASFMPRVLATARIHSVILPLPHSWTSFLNIITFPCCVSGTFSILSGDNRLMTPKISYRL
ncbi:Cytochrome c biogenesis CcmF N-terminal-like mitochondrial protein 2 [Capsicum annuum]|nr:Cytochrome c biogenesis CcmF N-terminal-like mitochondrial protein 2 [Capsicum annuum]